jgi:hypothetical protein
MELLIKDKKIILLFNRIFMNVVIIIIHINIKKILNLYLLMAVILINVNYNIELASAECPHNKM